MTAQELQVTAFQTTVAPRRFIAEPEPVALPLHSALTGGVSADEKAAVLKHYTRMAAQVKRERELMDEALERRRLLDDKDAAEPVSDEDAQEEAEHECLTNAAAVTDWLADACNEKYGPHDTLRMQLIDIDQCSDIGVLLSLILTGSHAQLCTARGRLRDILLADWRDVIAENAKDIADRDARGMALLAQQGRDE